MIKRIQSGISSRDLGFDYLSFIQKSAVKLGLTGNICTRDDGTIRVTAEGEEENLAILAQEIEKNTTFGPVQNFYVDWEEPLGQFADFSITTSEGTISMTKTEE